MRARKWITKVLREYPRRGWRRLRRLWAPKKPIKRNWALKEYAWKKYIKAREAGRKKRAARWLERHRKAKAKYFEHLRIEREADSGYNAATHTSAWDGFRVAAWMRGDEVGPDGRKFDWLGRFAELGWDGQLYSGWRSPEYSESLCYDMCNAPSCPGLCAGKNSNHSQTGPPNWGAVDVVDWQTFQSCNNAVGGPFRNDLPNDRVHRSVTGY